MSAKMAAMGFELMPASTRKVL